MGSKDIRPRKKTGKAPFVIAAVCVLIAASCAGGAYYANVLSHPDTSGVLKIIKGSTLTYDQIDTEPPVIGVDDEITLLKESKVDLDKMIKKNTTDDFGSCSVTVSGDVDLKKTGKYELEISASDLVGNTADKTFTVNVIDPAKQKGDYSFTTDKGFLAEYKDGVLKIDGIEVVNRSFPVREGYATGLTQETKDAFAKMREGASKDGVAFKIVSGYRSYSQQRALYNGYIRRVGYEVANSYSARPGHSEHHLGEAMDLNLLKVAFADTREGRWLNEHCWEYGFIMRYPEGKTDYTGYISEPWHVRYVGKKLAKKMYNDGDWITMEEYFGIKSEYLEDE